MPHQYSSEKIKALSIELKNVKKLIKYQNSFQNAPENYKPALLRKIVYLQKKVGLDDQKKLNLRKQHLEHRLENLNKTQQEITYLQHLSGWYLRPLINHFDSAQKIQTLTSETQGIPALQQKPKLFIPQKYLKNDDSSTQQELGQFFSFKAYGKGADQSKELQDHFYNQFQFTSKNPLQQTTIGNLGLPAFHYNTSLFWGQCKNGISSTLVIGLCPLSTINDELGFKLKNGDIIRPEIGFEELSEIHQDIEYIMWPERPILTDYLKIKTILELYKEHQEFPNLSVIIWYPYHEYLLDLTENILRKYIDNNIFSKQQLIDGLDHLKIIYMKLFELVKGELELTDSELENNIRFLLIDKTEFENLEQYRARLDLSFFQYIYGSFKGNELRHKLYEQLVIKHILPTFESKNVLHLDTSYELWVDILGTVLVENEKNERFLKGNYSWINYPSLPSISLSHMREYNAPHNDKLYLAEGPELFKKRVDKQPKKYLLYIAPLILGRKGVIKKDDKTIIKMMKERVMELNKKLI
jgi:hypothetical protein